MSYLQPVELPTTERTPAYQAPDGTWFPESNVTDVPIRVNVEIAGARVGYTRRVPVLEGSLAVDQKAYADIVGRDIAGKRAETIADHLLRAIQAGQ